MGRMSGLPSADARRIFRTFAELYAAVGTLRSVGDHSAALDLVRRHVGMFALHRALVELTTVELLAELGRPKEALAVLDRAVISGCRYRRDWLIQNPRLSNVVSLPEFSDLTQRSQLQWDDAASTARPGLWRFTPRTPPPQGGFPLLLVLHGNNSNAKETVPYWAEAVQEGWVVAVAQSGEPGATPGAFTWNDRERTGDEIQEHLATLQGHQPIDPLRVVIGGFSMGAHQAIALVLTRRIPARGIVPVASWLPNVREFASLIGKRGAPSARAYVVVGTADPSRAGARDLVDVLNRHGGSAFLDARDDLGHDYPSDMRGTLSRALAFVG
jgi:predicted esterase